MNFVTQNRDSHIMGIQLSGSAVHYFSDRKFTLDENTVYFLNQKEDYRVKVHEKGVAVSIHFTTYEPIDTESFCRKMTNPTEIVQLLKIIEREFLTKDDELRLMSDVYHFCSKLQKIHQKPYSPKDKRMLEAEKYMKSHFSEKNCLSEAVGISGLSRRRFNDLFANFFGLTPNKYLIALKIDYAQSLIGMNYLNTSQIAEMSGFSDIYYFCKVFKSQTGKTPGEYRKKLGRS